jgi:hypothetical protein
MSVWVWPAVVFAGVLLVAAVRRGRFGLAAGFAAYAAISAWLAGATAAPVRFTAPLIALVGGYWLTAPFYTSPSPRLEAWLIRFDDRLDVDRLAAAMPRALGALLEASYAGCYAFMIASAIPAFLHSRQAFAWHWTMVLAAELACYVTLPWLQARPPWKIGVGSQLFFPEAEKIIETRPQLFRRLNEALLQKLSVQGTTIPSGHVAGPVAASLGVWMVAPQYAPWFLAGAALIAAATVAGRYHYAIDAVMGVAAGAIPPAIRWFWI